MYVDDMKLAWPAHLMEEAWAKLGEGISLEKRKGNAESQGQENMTFLGCELSLVEKPVLMPNGEAKKAKGIIWGVSHSMKRCVAKYEAAVHAIAGRYPRIVPADTPFVPSETKFSRCRAP